MTGITPDELPAWVWIPSALILWGIWVAIKIGDARERIRRIQRGSRDT